MKSFLWANLIAYSIGNLIYAWARLQGFKSDSDWGWKSMVMIIICSGFLWLHSAIVAQKAKP